MNDHDNDSLDKLWSKYKENKSIELKNQLVVYYINLVKSIVKRFMLSHQSYNDFDDLVSYGVLGLMDAIDKYDMSRDIKFETYASKRIRGEIIDNIRKLDWAPSSLRRKITNITKANEELEIKFQRKPTDEEIAEYTGMTLAEYNKVLESSNMFNLVYFEDMLDNSYTNIEIKDKESDIETEIENHEFREILAMYIDELPKNEKLVVTLYYYEELSFKQIANVLDVTQSRISQIHSKALLRLKNKLAKAV